MLLRQRRVAFLLALAVSVPLAASLVLNAYAADLDRRYDNDQEGLLVVQQSGTMGEFHGSRLGVVVGEDLRARGIPLVVPEIHAVVGTTPSDAVLLRGVHQELYRRVERFGIVAGRPLLSGDPPRAAMVGASLAEQRGAVPGGTVAIRGREYRVVGVHSTGTYADYEVWIALADAQAMLGWDDDVSIYVIPAGRGLSAGDELPGGLSVVAKGDSGRNLLAEFDALLRLLDVIVVCLGITAAVTLANALMRLAWVHRREIAILRAIGFSRTALAAYLVAQGAAVTMAGLGLALVEAVVIGAVAPLETAAIPSQPDLDPRTLALGALFAASVLVVGTAGPVVWLARADMPALLRAE